ncbi:MAG: serine/threonine-protein kinase [Acidobacteriota bacterium]|nr:MAG: serine/threonine-protein kinase [Acidobacteriota bacterium]
MIGQVIAHYRIEEKLGAGGMGEVYRAHDTRLNRNVALKILPQDLAGDSHRISRFEREAQLLASLSHPNIAQIYGIEEVPRNSSSNPNLSETDGGSGVDQERRHQGRSKALILELVEGETLAEIINRGPVPVDEAIRIALEVAKGLEAAHERGVVHRDLKPANIKITPEGEVKILDFGLAKALEGQSPLADLSASVTLSLDATQTGVIVGTVAYLSPEQIRGKPGDRRSDIWAYGCVVYEMLCGRQPFEAATGAEVLARVLQSEPEWLELPRGTPQLILRLLQRCLAKQPRERLQAIGDARLELQEWLRNGDWRVTDSGNVRESSRRMRWFYLVFALLGAAVLFWAGARWGSQRGIVVESNPPKTVRADVSLPAENRLAFGLTYGFDPTLLAISPDGTKIVYAGRSSSGTQLYLRELSSLAVQALPDTQGAVHPFFSPDGQWVGFLTFDRLKKVSLNGGGAISLCDARTGTRAIWTREGTIYFGQNEGWEIRKVSENGGESTRVGVGLLYSLLPDEQWALIGREYGGLGLDYRGVDALSLVTGERIPIVERAYDARCLPSGHLLFSRNGTLMVAPFDAETRRIQSDPKPLVSGMSMESFFGFSQFTASQNGSLAYCPGGDAALGRIVRIDRQGNVNELDLPTALYGMFDVSPDGEKVVAQVADIADYLQLWNSRSGELRTLSDAERRSWPSWGPSSQRLAYTAVRGEETFLEVLDLESGRTERIHWEPTSKHGFAAQSWTPNEDLIAISDWDKSYSISVVPTKGGTEVFQFQSPEHMEWSPSFSPDGKWMAYTSDESGKFEVWIRSFPDGEVKHQISGGEGAFIEPLWCPSGELFFRSGNRWLASRVVTSPTLKWERPEVVWETSYHDTPGISYDVSEDGQYLYVVKSLVQPQAARLIVVLNWTKDLTELAPPS